MKKIGKARKLYNGNEKAVSPVIGVVLMVAVTVVLAAVIAGFVLSISMTPVTPQASFAVKSCSENTGGIILEHRGGDSIPIGDVSGTIDPDGASGATDPESAEWGFSIDINSNGIIDPGDQIDSTAATTSPTSGKRYGYTIFHIPTGQGIATGEVTTTD